jgi:uncharacterized protein YeeX (DUF496 family)
MIIFLLLFFGLLVLLSLYSRRFKNPYKLIFIFGKKGAGKSTLMVHMMLKDIKRGWTVYTDMQDVCIPGVRIIESSKLLDQYTPEPGSSVYVDEGGIAFDNRNFKNFTPGLRDFFKLQRKYRTKIVMNSQSFDVDKKIRDLTDSMILQTNIGNIFTLSRPIIRKITVTQSTSEADSRIADDLKFGKITTWRIYFMPKYFRWFKSFDAPFREFVPWRDAVPELLKSPSQALQEADNE